MEARAVPVRLMAPSKQSCVLAWKASMRKLLSYALIVGWVALLCMSHLACGRRDVRHPFNVLLISVDTLRSDHCSVYGYDRQTTPVLEQLAAEGALFLEAYSPTSLTQPTHASLFTSLHPIGHRVIRNGLVLGEEFLTVAEVLTTTGYQTAGFVSSYPMDERFGIAQGFEHFDDDFVAGEEKKTGVEEWARHKLEGVFDRRGNVTTDRAIGWLEQSRDRSRPLFLFVHYFEPHAPYAPLEPYRSKFLEGNEEKGRAQMISFYDGAVSSADHEIGRLLEWLRGNGLLDKTLVIVTADHGEGLMEHGRKQHSVNVYEEAVRVPLVMRLPGVIKAGARVAGPVSLLDVTPTVLDLLGVEAGSREFDGESLAGAASSGSDLFADRPIFLAPQNHTTARQELGTYAVRVGRWKLVEWAQGRPAELYDLDADPDESRSLSAKFPALREELSATLGTWFEESRAQGSAPSVTEAERRGLRALGYVD